MEIEFWRGPLDGVVQAIPDDVKLWIVFTPRSAPIDQSRVPTDAPPPEAVAPVDEHAYAMTERFGIASGARVFEYVGERVKKK